MPTSLPVLNLRQSLNRSSPTEREVDRTILLDTAPDREEFLIKSASIHEIRQGLKLQTPNTSPEHWLYRVRRRKNVRLRKDATIPLSTFNSGSASESDNGQSSESSIVVVDRVTSAPSVSSDTARRRSVDQTSYDNSSEPISSETASLVSPRELGPTHILVVHTLPPKVRVGKLSCGRRRIPSVYPEILELAINDLIFIANVPNLNSKGRYLPILPRRLPNDLPRVLLRVPHLHTFPELIVYLHTKDQAALFRSLIPDWAHDVMSGPINLCAEVIYPLSQPLVQDIVIEKSTPSSRCCGPMRHFKIKKGLKFFPCVGSSSTLEEPIPFISLDRMRAVDSVGAEVADAVGSIQHADSPEEALRNIVRSLDGLRDNLDHIGYFEHELWVELMTYRSILLSAISYLARVQI